MLKIGHRGAKGYVAENTLASFQKAIDLGCHGIELDVQTCKTGEIVVHHDTTIDRTTNGSGAIKDLNLIELQHYNIPTLEQVLDLVQNYFLVNIELKSNDCVEKVIKIVSLYITEKNWTLENFVLSSFDWTNLEAVYAFHPKIKTAVLTEKSVEKAIEFASTINAFAINPHYKLLTAKNVALCKQEGFKIYTWTVNEFSDIEKMKLLNVHGIISDFPDKIS